MTDDETAPRSIELEVEVPGSPDQVWAAIATGPGITAWFVPTEVDGRPDGVVAMDFGSGMKAEGRVTRWEPPTAFAYAGEDGLAFEFLVETGEGGTCIVRLVNSGFGAGTDWDGQYDGMTEGWKLFLHNLRLHLTHFPGQRCRSVTVNGVTPGPHGAAWTAYTGALALPAAPAVGSTVAAGAAPGGGLAGTVDRVAPGVVTLLTEAPAPGVAFVAAEGDGEQVALSFYGYFYGPVADEVAPAWSSAWTAWMAERFPMPAPGSPS